MIPPQQKGQTLVLEKSREDSRDGEAVKRGDKTIRENVQKRNRLKPKRSFGNYLGSKESRHRTGFGIQGVIGFWVIHICCGLKS